MQNQDYQQRREAIAKALEPAALLILAGNSEIERTLDTPYPFRQSSNFLYLTGVRVPDAILVMSATSTTLYIEKLHPFMEIWEGRVNRVADLAKVSGITDIQEYDALDDLLPRLLKQASGVVYVDMPGSPTLQPAAWNLWRRIQNNDYERELAAINPLINHLRVIKSPAEITLMKNAIHETDLALQHVQPLLVPGVTEREVAAEIIRFSAARGYEHVWPPIVSFGKNSCTIHHAADATKLKNGDFVLFDVGVEVEGYAADISRLVVTGAVTVRQKQILRAVRQLQKDCIALMKPGVRFDDYEAQTSLLVQELLVKLGIFASLAEAQQPDGDHPWPIYRRYYSHYTSHYLGLDAHDVGDREAEFVPGMVLTCEPGIYIAEEGLGVRLEDDILITTNGNENLSKNVLPAQELDR